MIQLQRWQDFDRIVITNEQYHGSVQVNMPNTPEARKEITDGYADAMIYALWVDEIYRGQKVGLHLLEAAEEQARKHGAKTVALEWDRRDTPEWVLDWYERLGYDEKEFGRYSSLLVKVL